MTNLIIKEKYSNVLLLTASLFFYAWGEPILVLLMMFTIIFNWLLGKMIIKQSGASRKLVLATAIMIDLGIIGYNKYSGFLVSIINAIIGQDLIPNPGIRLPIGISFFTFQAIYYIIDVYREDVEESPKLINMALYISFSLS